MHDSYSVRPLSRPAAVPRRRRGKRWPLAVLLLIVIAIAAYSAYAMLRPLPDARVTITPPVTPALVKVNIPWPNATERQQSAFGAVGYGLLAESDKIKTQVPLPTASIAKTITALAVLEKKPLSSGQQGPAITLTERDVALYNEYIAKDGSVVPVAAGEQISEYQALQAMMLPSANNIADTTAIWAFGSLDAYTAYANEMVKKLGMDQTTVSDASGFSPATVSTAPDLILLGIAAMGHPVLSEIVGQSTAVFPGYGTIRNVNNLLGQSGIRGIKTGNTDEAGGTFLGAADVKVGNKTITVITAIMAAPDRPAALRATVPLVQSAPSQFQTINVVRAGQKVGTATTEWGGSSDIIADKDISVTAWTGTAIAATSSSKVLDAPAKAGTGAGQLGITFNGEKLSSELELKDSLVKPSVWWRLTHPY